VTRVAVVGGGITGLAAAWELLQRGAEVVLLEGDGRLGGKVATSDVGGQPIDAGPDAFLARVPWALQLCRELGLADELVSPATGGAYVATPAGLRRLPEGLVLGVPAKVGPMVRSGLLSPKGLLRAGLEPVLPGRALAAGDDVAVGALVRRRFGREVQERLVDPLVGSINAGSTDHLSVVAAVPQLADVATRSRSLLLGLRAGAKRQAAAAAAANGNGSAPAPAFLTHPAGLGHLVATLADRLRDGGADLRTGVRTEGLAPRPGGGWDVALAGGGVEAVDAVVVATPAGAAADLVAPHAATAAALLRGIGYASVALLTLVVDPADIGRPLDGSGLLVPRGLGDGMVTAVSWGSSKWAHWGGPGRSVLRVSLGHEGDRRPDDLDDDDLVARACAELDGLMALHGSPRHRRVSRWPASFPQYRPGHLDRVAAIERDVAAGAPGVRLAGAAYRGLGIPACIRQGREAAAALVGGATG
jgi:oxygen-dependent protoporphyrinogen oxidase